MNILLNHAREGDRQALAKLLCEQRRMLESVVGRYLRNREQAPDTMQCIFTRVLESIGAFDGSACRFSTWLFRIAVNECRMQNRYAASRRERSMSMLPEECRPFPDPTAADGLRKLADRELHAAIRAAVDTLPPATRQAFVLYYLRGDSGREAAAQLGISEPAFFMRLKSGRDAVRKQLITKGWQV